MSEGKSSQGLNVPLLAHPGPTPLSSSAGSTEEGTLRFKRKSLRICLLGTELCLSQTPC